MTISGNIENKKGLNVFLLVIISTIIYVLINIFFYQLREDINYFELSANSILLMTTFYLIYVTQKNSTNKSDFYYYTSIGFTFVFFGLFILTLNHIYRYSDEAVKVSVKLLFVFGYALLAIGITKWVRYNETRKGELRIQANTDALTGLLNRRSITNFIQYEFNKVQSDSQTFSIIIIDVDFFKKVNDQYGHLIGDQVLLKLASILKGAFRSSDKVSRWGGEEFAVLLPGTQMNHAAEVAEKIRRLIDTQAIKIQNFTLHITISLGVSEFLKSDKCIDNMINRADKALYAAKNHNRNCVKFVR